MMISNLAVLYGKSTFLIDNRGNYLLFIVGDWPKAVAVHR